MLRNLITDRFKLNLRRELRGTEPGYALLLGKDGREGVKLKETSDPEQGSWGRPGGLPCRQPPCPILISGNFSMKRFAADLGTLWTGNGWVLDKTGLPGTYSLSLTLNPLPQPPRPPQEGPRGVGGGSANKLPKEYNPTLPKAIEEQLGLRLEYGHQVPVEHWIVDHVEMPSEN
jgi:uncharacterized protein (TIGR03435 family)